MLVESNRGGKGGDVYPNGWIVAAARTGFVLGTLALVVLSLAPTSSLPPVAIWDKLAHAIAYGSLAACGTTGFAAARARRVIVMLLVVLGAGIEAAQPAVGGREGSLEDMAANVLGIAAGYIVARIVHAAAHRRRAHHERRD